MTTHNQRVTDLTEVYATIVGKAFDELTESQLRILLANEYWKDGMDIEQVFTEMFYAKDEDKPSKEKVILELKSVFGYTFKTIIE